MTRLPAEPLRLDRLIRAGGIHSMTGERYRSVGVRGASVLHRLAYAQGAQNR